MNQDGTRDLAWWRIPGWASARVLCIASGLSAGLTLGIMAGLIAMLVAGLTGLLVPGLQFLPAPGFTAMLRPGFLAGLVPLLSPSRPPQPGRRPHGAAPEADGLLAAGRAAAARRPRQD